MGEKWKDIKDYEGLYQVSNYGRVKRLEGKGLRKDGITTTIKRRILTKSINHRWGYEYVTLTKNSNRHCTSVHRLVTMAFLDHKPKGNKKVINHIDGDKTNNKLSNLEVVTNRENSTVCFKEYKNKRYSKQIGVTYSKESYRRKRWKAMIQINGKNKFLGYFNNESDAGDAYQNALVKFNVEQTVKYK